MIEEGHHHERRIYAEDVASMEAAAMLVERSHFERLGGFDPWIFLYNEDNDICYRTWLLGRRVVKAWDAVADHDVGGTGGGLRWSGEQIKNGLYVHLKLRGWPATGRYAARMAAKTFIRGARLRDPAVLDAWRVNARELPSTLSKRRAIRGAASGSRSGAPGAPRRGARILGAPLLVGAGPPRPPAPAGPPAVTPRLSRRGTAARSASRSSASV